MRALLKGRRKFPPRAIYRKNEDPYEPRRSREARKIGRSRVYICMACDNIWRAITYVSIRKTGR